MSSRGQHVGGTDGTDHQYRERVAAQYGVSATNKARLKLLVSVHYLLGAAHLARLVPHLVKYLGVDLEMPLPPTPAPNSFVEYFWLLSLPFTLMAMMAARKSNAQLLQMFQMKISICCIVPIIVTLLNDAPSIIESISDVTNHSKSDLYFGFPFVILWSFVLFICLIVHVFEVLVCRTLINAWAPRHSKKKQ